VTVAGAAADRLPAVSVVVPTYRRGALLPRVVAPILDDRATTELVVVVDGARDGSLELLQDLAHKDPRLKPVWTENGGEHAAREAGAVAASGEVLLFLDDDVIARPGLVEGHARHHARERGIVVLGYMPVAAPPPGQTAPVATRLYMRSYEHRCRAYAARPEGILEHLWAGNVSIRRDDYLGLPPGSPKFATLYFGDRDLGLRCLKAGLRGCFDPSLLASHLHTRSLDAFLRECWRQGAGERVIHELHGDLIGPFDPDILEQGLPLPARRLVQAVSHGNVYRIARPLMRGVTEFAGWLRCHRVETVLAQLLRRVERRRGAYGEPRLARH
jgi:GT2 family glycosyltransferase